MESRDALPVILAIKTLVFTVLVPGLVTVYIPVLLLARAQPPASPLDTWLAVPAAFLMLAGVAGYLCCARDFVVRGQGTPAPFDAPKRLVVSGLYRWTRNPMFASIVLILLGEALLFRSRALFVFAGGTVLTLHLLVVLFEEPRLRKRFGPAYADYCRVVPRWGFGGRGRSIPESRDLDAGPSQSTGEPP
jgi:protein-S-isoprenylcysteine O-methyltransferase Ste14